MGIIRHGICLIENNKLETTFENGACACKVQDGATDHVYSPIVRSVQLRRRCSKGAFIEAFLLYYQWLESDQHLALQTGKMCSQKNEKLVGPQKFSSDTFRTSVPVKTEAPTLSFVQVGL